jgi:hypothetical protein
MKNVLKLESLGLFLLFTCSYFVWKPGAWGIFLALFFVPDVSFLLIFVSKKATVIAYDLLHHQGFLAILTLLGFYFHSDWCMQIGLIFLAHSTFDRIVGYGLKYTDSLDHTHLGWVGKSKHLNISGD